jgi:hypothetical protein
VSVPGVQLLHESGARIVWQCLHMSVCHGGDTQVLDVHFHLDGTHQKYVKVTMQFNMISEALFRS